MHDDNLKNKRKGSTCIVPEWRIIASQHCDVLRVRNKPGFSNPKLYLENDSLGKLFHRISYVIYKIYE